MDRYRAMRLTGMLLVATGIVLLAWAALEGQVSFALVFVIPVLYGAGPLALLSFLMILAGITVVILSLFGTAGRMDTTNGPETRKREWGGVVLIGPVPIVFGSAGMLRDRKALILLAVFGILVLAVFLLILTR